MVDLTYETFITRERGSGTRMLMAQFFQASDLQPKVGMEMDCNETIKQAVIAGLGIAFISPHTVASELADGRLVVLDVAGLPVMRQWYAVRAVGQDVASARRRRCWSFSARKAPTICPRLGCCGPNGPPGFSGL